MLTGRYICASTQDRTQHTMVFSQSIPRRRRLRTGALLLALLASGVSCREPIAPTPSATTAVSSGETAVATTARAKASAAPYTVDAATIETRYWNSGPWYVNCGTYACWAPGFPGLTATAAYFDALPRNVPGYSNTPVALPSLTCGSVTPAVPGGSVDTYDSCLRNPGDGTSASHSNVAMRYRVLISGGATGATLAVRFGVDFMGGVMLVDGQVVAQNWNDPAWWGYFDTDIAACDPVTLVCGTPILVSDPNSTLVGKFTAAAGTTHIVEVIGFENGADYGAGVQFAGADSVWRDATSANVQKPLTLQLAAGAGGHITTASGLNCPGSCSGPFSWGTKPVLTAVPDEFFLLSAWGGACSGTGVCEPMMETAQSVTATFVRDKWPVTVTLAGSGTGTVTSSVAGISCGTTCRAGFKVGSTVVLTAAPTNGASVAWSGCTTSSGNTCTITNLQAAKAITTTFTQVASKLAVATPAAGAASGVVFTTQPIVAIQDAGGTTVTASSASVTMSVSAGGTLIGTVTRAAVNGVATFSGVGLSGLVGSYTLTFASSTLTSATQTIALTPGTATRLVLTTPAAGASSGTPFTTQPVVAIRDAAGNTTSSTAAVTMTVAGTGATVVGPGTVAAQSGVATFAGVGLSGTPAASYTLTYASNGLTSATQTVALIAGAAAQMALYAGNNQSVGAGSQVTTPPSVVVKDAGGNPVSGVTVTFAVLTGGGSATGTAAVTNAAGIAAVGSWTLGATPGANTMSASASGLSGSPVLFSATGMLVDTPADLSCVATPNVLWPPNHKMSDIRIKLPAGTFLLTSVTSNEADDAPEQSSSRWSYGRGWSWDDRWNVDRHKKHVGGGRHSDDDDCGYDDDDDNDDNGDGSTVHDIQGWLVGTADVLGQLRAERSGSGTGRIYTFSYSGKDASGKKATATCTVTVPHDQGGRH